MPKIYSGTAGWSYKDWIPGFYPREQTKEFDWLKYYSAYFNVVEVNSTYYAYTNPRIVQRWIEKVSDSEDFRFTIKLHQDFTHKRKYEQGNIQAVQYTLKLLDDANRLGGLLIQFPYSFPFNNSSLQYINELKDIFLVKNLFVEVRHTSWNNKTTYEFFKQQNITFCIIDQPQVGNSIKFEPILTSDTAYIRFHGRNFEAWKNSVRNYGREQTYEQQNERYKYLYTPGELAEIDQELRKLFSKVKEIYIIMNNHPTGYAVANAFELLFMLSGKEKLNIPESTKKAFPRLLSISLN